MTLRTSWGRGAQQQGPGNGGHVTWRQREAGDADADCTTAQRAQFLVSCILGSLDCTPAPTSVNRIPVTRGGDLRGTRRDHQEDAGHTGLAKGQSRETLQRKTAECRG